MSCFVLGNGNICYPASASSAWTQDTRRAPEPDVRTPTTSSSATLDSPKVAERIVSTLGLCSVFDCNQYRVGRNETRNQPVSAAGSSFSRGERGGRGIRAGHSRSIKRTVRIPNFAVNQCVIKNDDHRTISIRSSVSYIHHFKAFSVSLRRRSRRAVNNCSIFPYRSRPRPSEPPHGSVFPRGGPFRSGGIVFADPDITTPVLTCSQGLVRIADPDCLFHATGPLGGVSSSLVQSRRRSTTWSWNWSRRKRRWFGMADDGMQDLVIQNACFPPSPKVASLTSWGTVFCEHLPILLAGVCIFRVTWILLRLLIADADLTLLDKGPPPPKAFEDKVVWIIGSSQGLGETLARRFSDLGAKLILSARRETELQRVKASCSGKHVQDDGIYILPFDVAGRTDVINAAVSKAVDAFGGVDFVVLNAAYARTKTLAYEFDESLLEGTFDVNVIGPMRIARALLPGMLELKKGHFVVISSAAGKVPSPTQALYSASKFALNGYFRSLDYEFRNQGVGATVICPGPVGTSSDPTQKKERRVSSERCAELVISAAGHKVPEAWISLFPILQIMYLVQYIPSLGHLILSKVSPNRVRALKEGGDSMYSASLIFKSKNKKRSPSPGHRDD